MSVVDLGSPSSINRLDQAAKSAGITIIPHCGLDPGIDRILISYGVSKLDTVEEVTVRCGGFPQKNLLPCPLEGEGDLVVMRVDVNGYRSGRREALTFEMIDRYDERNGLFVLDCGTNDCTRRNRESRGYASGSLCSSRKVLHRTCQERNKDR